MSEVNTPMSDPGRIETASAVLRSDRGRFLFQLRDDIPNILYPGLIGLFGGHLERGETPLQAVCREVHEEVGIDVPPPAFSVLAECAVPVSGGGQLSETVFFAAGIPVQQTAITEGRLLLLDVDEIPMHLAGMTPITCCAARLLMDRS